MSEGVYVRYIAKGNVICSSLINWCFPFKLWMMMLWHWFLLGRCALFLENQLQDHIGAEAGMEIFFCDLAPGISNTDSTGRINHELEVVNQLSMPALPMRGKTFSGKKNVQTTRKRILVTVLDLMSQVQGYARRSSYRNVALLHLCKCNSSSHIFWLAEKHAIHFTNSCQFLIGFCSPI